MGPAAEPPPPTWALDAGRRPVPGKRGDGHIAVLPVDAGVAASDVRTPDDERLMRCVPRDCRGRAAAPSLDQDRVAKSKLVALLAEAQRHLNLRVARVKAKAVERRACRQCAAVTTLTHHVAGGFTATHCRDCARASSGGTLVDARQRVVLTYNAPDVTGVRPTWTCPTCKKATVASACCPGQFHGDTYEVLSRDGVARKVVQCVSGVDAVGAHGHEPICHLLRRHYVGVPLHLVRDLVDQLDIQQRRRGNMTGGGKVRGRAKTEHNRATAKNQRWQIDLCQMASVAYNSSFIAVVIDVFTKFVWAWRVLNYHGKSDGKSTAAIVKRLREIIGQEQVQQLTIQADNGPQFISDEFKNFVDETANVELVLTRSYSPNQNACVERVNRTLKDDLRVACELHRTVDWPRLLSDVVDQYNARWHSSLRMSPFEAHRGRVPARELAIVGKKEAAGGGDKADVDKIREDINQLQMARYERERNARVRKLAKGRLAPADTHAVAFARKSAASNAIVQRGRAAMPVHVGDSVRLSRFRWKTLGDTVAVPEGATEEKADADDEAKADADDDDARELLGPTQYRKMLKNPLQGPYDANFDKYAVGIHWSNTLYKVLKIKRHITADQGDKVIRVETARADRGGKPGDTYTYTIRQIHRNEPNHDTPIWDHMKTGTWTHIKGSANINVRRHNIQLVRRPLLVTDDHVKGVATRRVEVGDDPVGDNRCNTLVDRKRVTHAIIQRHRGQHGRNHCCTTQGAGNACTLHEACRLALEAALAAELPNIDPGDREALETYFHRSVCKQAREANPRLGCAAASVDQVREDRAHAELNAALNPKKLVGDNESIAEKLVRVRHDGSEYVYLVDKKEDYMGWVASLQDDSDVLLAWPGDYGKVCKNVCTAIQKQLDVTAEQVYIRPGLLTETFAGVHNSMRPSVRAYWGRKKMSRLKSSKLTPLSVVKESPSVRYWKYTTNGNFDVTIDEWNYYPGEATPTNTLQTGIYISCVEVK